MLRLPIYSMSHQHALSSFWTSASLINEKWHFSTVWFCIKAAHMCQAHLYIHFARTHAGLFQTIFNRLDLRVDLAPWVVGSCGSCSCLRASRASTENCSSSSPIPSPWRPLTLSWAPHQPREQLLPPHKEESERRGWHGLWEMPSLDLLHNSEGQLGPRNDGPGLRGTVATGSWLGGIKALIASCSAQP